mmetsp:Transcript_23775/g.56227  ORF Transcript_23775/g.56227 Transcript_23775/m.56227 type:complete len:378 (-) Transcript_23775:89-1222(-)
MSRIAEKRSRWAAMPSLGSGRRKLHLEHHTGLVLPDDGQLRQQRSDVTKEETARFFHRPGHLLDLDVRDPAPEQIGRLVDVGPEGQLGGGVVLRQLPPLRTEAQGGKPLCDRVEPERRRRVLLGEGLEQTPEVLFLEVHEEPLGREHHRLVGRHEVHPLAGVQDGGRNVQVAFVGLDEPLARRDGGWQVDGDPPPALRAGVGEAEPLGLEALGEVDDGPAAAAPRVGLPEVPDAAVEDPGPDGVAAVRGPEGALVIVVDRVVDADRLVVDEPGPVRVGGHGAAVVQRPQRRLGDARQAHVDALLLLRIRTTGGGGPADALAVVGDCGDQAHSDRTSMRCDGMRWIRDVSTWTRIRFASVFTRCFVVAFFSVCVCECV